MKTSLEHQLPRRAIHALTAAGMGLALLLALAGSARATEPDTSDPEVAGRIQRELQKQTEMLSRLQKGESLDETDLSGGGGGPELGLDAEADPRVAPAAPQDRPLPVAIFEETRVEIPKGTWGNRSKLDLVRRVLDADRDGHPELVRYVDPATGVMVRQEEDRNYDGVTDAWSDYEDGRIVARALDSNDDGNPDTWERYADGRMTSREIDRDDDGVRDAFYRYENGSLVEERHDADNDGRIDRVVYYENRHRVRSEEDRDHDGRMDIWRTYVVVGDEEIVSRIESDEHGRGRADTFETYEPRDGHAVLAKREEDVNGDGNVDVASFYQDGKLVRREILDPDQVPM